MLKYDFRRLSSDTAKGENMTCGRFESSSSKIAVALALVFVLSVAVVGFDSAETDADPTADQVVEQGFEQILSIASASLYAEPSHYATVIDGDYPVNRVLSYLDDVVLKDGAVLEFSGSSSLIVKNLFIDGTVKFVNKDGSDSSLYVNNLYVGGVRFNTGAVKITTDGTVTVTGSTDGTGFYDPSTGKLDASRGIKGSVDAKVYIEGDSIVAEGIMRSITIYSGGSSPAVSVSGSMDLTGFYNSLINSMKGVPADEMTAKLVDFMYNKLVYPSLDMDVAIAKMESSGSTIEDVSASIVSSPSSKLVTVKASVGSLSGAAEIKDAESVVKLSVLKAEISGRVGSLHIADQYNDTDLTYKGMEFDVSMRGDRFVEMASRYPQYGNMSAFLDAVASSDMSVAGTVHLEADSMTGKAHATIDGAAATVEYSIDSISYDSEVDSGRGSEIKGTVGSLSFRSTSGFESNSVSLDNYYVDVSTTGKNVLSFLRYIPVPDSRGQQKEIDYEALAIDVLDGQSVKGEVWFKALEVESRASSNGKNIRSEEITRIAGDDSKNVSLKLDTSIVADAASRMVKATGTYDLDFSRSATLYYKSYSGTSAGFEGTEVIIEGPTADIQDLVIEGKASDFKDRMKAASTASLKVSVTSDIVLNSWASQGTSAYGETLDMDDVSFTTTVIDLDSVRKGDIPATAGGTIVVTSYKMADRGTGSYSEFSDFAAKAESTSSIGGVSFDYQPGQSVNALYIGDATSTIGGTEKKYTEVSKEAPVAYLSKNAAGFYEVYDRSQAVADEIPVYNVEGKAASDSDNTMLYVAIAIIVLVAAALAAYFILKRRGSGA